MIPPALVPALTGTHVASPPWTFEELGIVGAALLALGVVLAYLVPRLRELPSDRRARRHPDHKTMEPFQVEELLGGQAPLVVDLRSPEEFKGKLGRIRGAMNIPFPDLEKRMDELRGSTGNRPIVLVDRGDEGSHRAAAILLKHGFAWIYVLKGGMKAWVANKLPVYH